VIIENSKLVILVVDDNKSNIDILLNILSNYDCIPCLSGKNALEIINDEHIDLILLDIMMPEIDGFEVCKILKENSKTKTIPIIFITGQTDEDSIEKAYEIGGADYVIKPFRPKELLARVKKELNIQALLKELEYLASIDPMTKLYNRRYFTEVSEYTINLAKRDELKVSIIIIDIDKFKNINDTHGHQIGDEVIISLANTLQYHKRKSDIVCRYGGDEFVMMLPNTSIEGARILAMKIKDDVNSNTIKYSNNIKLKFTISLGIAAVNSSKPNAIELSLKKADDALYEAKKLGRDRVC